jgi:hypothetical protein
MYNALTSIIELTETKKYRFHSCNAYAFLLENFLSIVSSPLFTIIFIYLFIYAPIIKVVKWIASSDDGDEE